MAAFLSNNELRFSFLSGSTTARTSVVSADHWRGLVNLCRSFEQRQVFSQGLVVIACDKVVKRKVLVEKYPEKESIDAMLGVAWTAGLSAVSAMLSLTLSFGSRFRKEAKYIVLTGMVLWHMASRWLVWHERTVEVGTICLVAVKL